MSDIRLTTRGESGRPTAVVLGGGLAGIAAAVRLAESGWRVMLLETRPRLGGRATSHVDPRTGGPLDNGQHVLLGCCTNLIDLYQRLGVLDRIEWHERIHFLRPGGGHDVLGPASGPAPLHLAGSLLRVGALSWPSKLAIARGMLAILRADPLDGDELATMTFSQWLARTGQPSEAIERFWNVFVVGALNEPADVACAPAALKVFRDGLLAHRRGYVMGVSQVPLVELYSSVGNYLRDRGGEVRLGTSIRGIELAGQGARPGVAAVRLADGSAVRGDAYVAALPHDRLIKLLPAGPASVLGGPSAYRPILGIHLWFDRRVLHLPHAALLDSPLHWLFDKGTADDGVQRLQAVVSSATAWIDFPAERIARAAAAEVVRYLPAATGARLMDWRIIKERRATFSVAVGQEARRPGTDIGIADLALAGDWTQTGWPATMEGAVRSGYLAAGHILNRPVTVPDLPRACLVRWLSST